MNETINNPLNLILIIIGSFLGLSIGLFLLFNRSAKSRANLYLGALVLVITTYFLPAFFYRFDLFEQFPHVIGISRIVGFLIGPLAYLYVRSCTQKGFGMRPVLWLHFLPFCLDLLYDLPFFMQGGSDKIDFYLNFIKDGNFETHPILLLTKIMHGLFYFGLSAKLVLMYRKHLSDSTSSIDTAFHHWLLIFIMILALPIISLMGFAFTDFQKALLTIGLLSFFAFILAVYIAALSKPALFHAFPHQMLLPDSSEEQKEKYENSNLKTDQKEKMVKKLINYVETEKPYQAAELTLAQLSGQVKIPAHYLSQVINEKLDCNFLDFINTYRVKEAQEKLVDPKCSHYTILSIAYDAGFNSKSTFYSAFKKQTGATPTQYRKSAMGN